MTPREFRRIALGLEAVEEGAHHGHRDFRVGGRIFASLGYPDRKWGMVSLTPEHQHIFVSDHPGAFVPVKGKWGEQGATNVRLDLVDEETLGEVLTLARQNILAKQRVRLAVGKRDARGGGGRRSG
jgi:hypothetical protein